MDFLTRFWPPGRQFAGPNGVASYGKYQALLQPTLALVMQHTAQYGTVLHAGGHIGLLSIALASLFDQVIVFEASEVNAAWLKQNTEALPHIHVTYGALGTGAPARLVQAKYSTCHYVLPGGDIPCWRIDDVPLQRLDVLVLDLEGGELVALRHALATLARCRPTIIVEEYARWMPRYARAPGDVARLLATVEYVQVGAAGLDLAFVPREREQRPYAA